MILSEEEVLIQFQGNSLKFYLHSANKNIAEKLIKFSKTQIKSNKIKFKNLTKRKENSCYIFETKINNNLNNEFTPNDIYRFLLAFYEKIDNKIVEPYIKFNKFSS